MKWFNILKARYSDRRKPSKRNRTTPSGSRQAKLEQLVDDLLSGKITEQQYKDAKDKLDSGE
jgi:hypothetical protein